MSSSNLLTIFLFSFSFFSMITYIHPELVIREPKALRDLFPSGVIKTGTSNFGRIQYGHKMEGYLLFDTVNETATYGCDKFTRYAEMNPEVGRSPFVLVREGHCTFATKIRNIEEAGGHVGIVVSDANDNDLDMFDDGRGRDIAIPSIRISRDDGEKLISYYKSNMNKEKGDIKKIRIEIIFELEKQKNFVDYGVWYRPDDPSVYIFLKEFYKYQEALGDIAKLDIHFITYTDYSYSEDSQKEIKNCLGSGFYCMIPGTMINVSDGAIIIDEMIRQKCVFNYAYQEGNNKLWYWRYMKNFHELCLEKGNMDTECANEVLYDLDLSKVINQCYKDSFIGSDSQKSDIGFNRRLKNSILDEEIKIRNKLFINNLPTLTINNKIYSGAIRPQYIFESLCASLIKKPKVCFDLSSFNNDLKAEEGYSISGLFFILLLIIVGNIIIFMLCKRVIKNKIIERFNTANINTKIDTVVNSYLALRDQSSKE